MSGPAFQTRAQRDLTLALECVRAVEKVQNDEMQKIYGGLCHNFPVLVRTAGLCQALAFSEDKRTGEKKSRTRAHELILEHVGEIMRASGATRNALETARTADALEYMHYTRRVLEAFVYFKRFAVSVLKVENARSAEDGL